MKKGFTLAEVLITLVIIGVVSALTIPVVLKNYQKHQTEVKLKKVYSMLNEAINRARADYGDPVTWDWSESYDGTKYPKKLADKYIRPYLNIADDHDNFALAKKWNVSYTGHYYGYSAKLMDGTSVTAPNNFYIADGTGISFSAGGYSWSNDPWVWITVDINGQKKPNIYGKDIFNLFFFAKRGFTSNRWVSCLASGSFYLCSLNGYIAYNGREAAINQCKSNSIATYCFDLIKDNNWKIPDDYPW